MHAVSVSCTLFIPHLTSTAPHLVLFVHQAILAAAYLLHLQHLQHVQPHTSYAAQHDWYCRGWAGVHQAVYFAA